MSDEEVYYATVVNNEKGNTVTVVGTFNDFGNRNFENYVRTCLYCVTGDVVKFLDTKKIEYRALNESEQQQFLLVKLSAVPVAQAEL